MSPANRQEMFRRLAAANPDPQSELEYGSPYQLLAAVLLSAQAVPPPSHQARLMAGFFSVCHPAAWHPADEQRGPGVVACQARQAIQDGGDSHARCLGA